MQHQHGFRLLALQFIAGAAAVLLAATIPADAGAAARSELQQLVESLDWSDAPEPKPEKIVEDGRDVYTGVTAAYLLYFFDKLGYSGAKVAAGETSAVPPLVLLQIPKGWAEGKTVPLKKSLFYRVVLPLILLENERTLEERSRLLALQSQLAKGTQLAGPDQRWLAELAREYRVTEGDEPVLPDLAGISELLRRVDMLPPSLALGQAAYESGYATSRFAHEGNALFGQWTWGGGIKPADQRSGKGDYGIRSFEFPRDSVHGYFMNLNTHPSYAALRDLRADQRGKSQGRIRLDSIKLSRGLVSYSERGEDYVSSLQGIIRHNQLQIADDLRLLEGGPIYFR